MAKANDLAFMLQTIGPTMGQEFTSLILSEIAELKNMPKLANELRNFDPQPDPMEIAKAEAEVQLAQAKAAETQASAQLKAAQAQYYEALASQGQLDFVEQESGVKQERALQLRAEQSKAQMALAERQAELKNRNKIAEMEVESSRKERETAAMQVAAASKALDRLAEMNKKDAPKTADTNQTGEES